jgi:hypothetical protein
MGKRAQIRLDDRRGEIAALAGPQAERDQRFGELDRAGDAVGAPSTARSVARTRRQNRVMP